jgi:hypothetical protein
MKNVIKYEKEALIYIRKTKWVGIVKQILNKEYFEMLK